MTSSEITNALLSGKVQDKLNTRHVHLIKQFQSSLKWTVKHVIRLITNWLAEAEHFIPTKLIQSIAYNALLMLLFFYLNIDRILMLITFIKGAAAWRLRDDQIVLNISYV